MISNIPKNFSAYSEEKLNQLSAGAIGKKGNFDVKFKVGSTGKTFLSNQFVTLPFHVTRGLYNDENIRDMVFLYIQMPSGGTIQGDRLLMDIECQENSKVHLTSQGPSKIYKMNKNYASQHIKLKVDKGAYLEYIPELTILFKDSRFLQMMDFEVDHDSTVLYSEIISPGRIAEGESFQFKIYQSELKVRDENGKIRFQDRIILTPDEYDTKRPGTMGGYDILGNFYIISSKTDAKELSDKIHQLMIGYDNVSGSATVLPNSSGVLVRVLGYDTRTVIEVMNHVWNETRKNILGVEAPRIRKY